MNDALDDFGAGPPDPMTGAASALDQGDIDALFGDVAAPAPPRTGLRALIEGASSGYERLPMLEIVCDRVLRTFSTSMRHLTSDAMEVSLEGVTSGRFGELMNQAALPAMFGVFRIDPWGGHGVMTIEPALIYGVVDALLGGRKGAPSLRVEGRAFTTIETALVGRFMELVFRDFAGAFGMVAPVELILERIETSPRFASVVAPAIGTANCMFRLEMEGRTGRFGLLLPTTTLEPVRDKLVQRFMGEKLGGDLHWSEHFDRELRRAPIHIDAVIAEHSLSVREISGLEVGMTLPLRRSADDSVALVHGDALLGSGQLGQRNGAIAVRLLDQLNGASA